MNVGSPPVVGDVFGPDQLGVTGSGAFSVTALDTNPVLQPLTYAWSAVDPNTNAPAGSFTGSGASVTWQAPPTTGTYAVSVTVSTVGGLSTTMTKPVTVVLASFQGDLQIAELRAPTRLVVSRDGLDGLFVVDGKQPIDGGLVTLLTPKLEVRGLISVPDESVTGITEGNGFLWVTTGSMYVGHLRKLDPATGRYIGDVPIDPPLVGARPLAWDPTRSVLWILQAFGDLVVVRPNGQLVTKIPMPGKPVDVAIDAAGNRAWVVMGTPAPEFGGDPGLKYSVFGWDLDGNYLGPIQASNSIAFGGGIAVGPDPDGSTSLARVYASDSWNAIVSVYSGSGASLGTIGTYGTGPGQLSGSTGVAILKNGDLAVASTSSGRIERFGSGTLLPTSCQTSDGKLDTDCDGMSDAWEDRAGLNKYSALDALAYFRTTGYLNYDLYAMAAAGNDPLAGPRIVQSGH
ncbi:MAG TPA: hypothetical protein VF875_14920, partial [Anaeromyxobacter sp.]